MPYPHDMGQAEKIWQHDIYISDISKMSIMGAVEPAKLTEDGADRWIGTVTFSVYLLKPSGNSGGASGYLYGEWFDTKEEATAAVIQHKHWDTKMSY